MKVIIAILIILFTAIVFADDVTLEWDPNTEPYLTGYKIHWGSTSGNYTSSLDVGKVTTAIIPNIELGTVFVATAYANDINTYLPVCMADPSMIEAYPDETARNTKCSENFGTGIKSGYSNEVVYEGGVAVVMLTPTELTVFKPGKRIVDSLEILYEFKGLTSTITDTSVGDASIDLVIGSGVVDRISGGGIQVVDSASIVSTDTGQQLIDRLTSSQITIEVWVKPLFTNQVGPARIVTFSQGQLLRNFTLGQDNDRYIVRLRTSQTDLQGMPNIVTPAGSLTDNLTHVVFTYEQGSAKIYIDGTEMVSESRTGDFSNWDGSMKIGLANEFIDDRAWLGAIHLVAIYSKALTSSEVMSNYQAGF